MEDNDCSKGTVRRTALAPLPQRNAKLMWRDKGLS